MYRGMVIVTNARTHLAQDRAHTVFIPLQLKHAPDLVDAHMTQKHAETSETSG